MVTQVLENTRILNNDSLKKNYTRIPDERPASAFREPGPLWVPYLGVRLAWGMHPKQTPTFQVLVDSGSPYCLFSDRIGRFLGIPVEDGKSDEIYGMSATMRDLAYFHKVRLFIEARWIVEITAGFVKGLTVLGILGRVGFFEQFRVCFDHSRMPPFFELTRIEKPH